MGLVLMPTCGRAEQQEEDGIAKNAREGEKGSTEERKESKQLKRSFKAWVPGWEFSSMVYSRCKYRHGYPDVPMLWCDECMLYQNSVHMSQTIIDCAYLLSAQPKEEPVRDAYACCSGTYIWYTHVIP